MAEPIVGRALKECEHKVGPDHPGTLASVNNLAGLYFSQERYAEAGPLCERALRDTEKVLGPSHPDTKLFRNNLAVLRSKMGRFR